MRYQRNDTDTYKNLNTCKKTHPSVTPPTKHTRTGLEWNIGLHSARPTTNHLSQGMVLGMVLYVFNAHYTLNLNLPNMGK
jgi:hypothetical protein